MTLKIVSHVLEEMERIMYLKITLSSSQSSHCTPKGSQKE